MRFVSLPVILLVAMLSSLGCSAPASEEPMLQAGDWTLLDDSGVEVVLSAEYASKPQIVLFWATWCPYCSSLMPHLQSILVEQDGDVTVLAVNVAEDGDPVAYLRERGYDFRLLLDGDPVAADWEVPGTPGVFLIGTDGLVHFNLHQLPEMDMKNDGEKLSHRAAAARLAPYWAAELRKSIDRLSL